MLELPVLLLFSLSRTPQDNSLVCMTTFLQLDPDSWFHHQIHYLLACHLVGSHNIYVTGLIIVLPYRIFIKIKWVHISEALC